MTDANKPGPEAEDGRPRLRCPACSFMVPLPAETCPKCRANLRSGLLPIDEEPASNRGRLIIAGLVLLVIIGLAVIFFSGILNGPQQPVAGRPAAGGSSGDGIGEALEAFQDLPAGTPGMNPDIYLNRAKDAAEQADDRRRMEREAEEFHP